MFHAYRCLEFQRLMVLSVWVLLALTCIFSNPFELDPGGSEIQHKSISTPVS